MSAPDPPTIESLLAIIVETQAEIATLRLRISELEAENERLRKGPSPPKPPVLSGLPHFVKPNRSKQPEDEQAKKRRRQRDCGYARRLSEPTRTEKHAVDVCPD